MSYCGRHNNKGTFPPLVKGGFGQLSLTYFQSFFVDAPAVLISIQAVYPLIRWS